MLLYAFTFRSMTAAQSARSILTRAGIRAEVRRAMTQASDSGCAWMVAVPGSSGRRAAAVLRMWQRPFGRVFRQYSGGGWEEMAL